MEKSQCTTRTALALAQRLLSEIIHVYVCVLRTLAAATVCGRRLFRSELSIPWLLFEGGVYIFMLLTPIYAPGSVRLNWM